MFSSFISFQNIYLVYNYHDHTDFFNAGKLYFIGKNCLHSRILDKTQACRLVLLRFEILDNQTHKPLTDLPDNTAFSFVTSNPTLYYDLFEQLFIHYSKKTTSSQTICQIIISQLIHEIYNEMIDTTIAQPIDNRIERVARHIRNNFTQNINLDKLISISGLSRNYFFKLFSKYYKTTPKQYQIQLKINYATTYLNETNMSIGEIADKLGYQDQFCFTKQFKQVIGVSPTAFRQSYIESNISLSSKD